MMALKSCIFLRYICVGYWGFSSLNLN